jgi:hypothetical protein
MPSLQVQVNETRQTEDFVICALSLVSVNLVSMVLERVYRRMNVFYLRLIFVHLLCSWVAAFMRLVIGIAVNSLSSHVGVVVLKVIENWFRFIAMATNLVMVWLYAYSLYKQGKNCYPSRAPWGIYVVYAFFGVYPFFQVGLDIHMSISRSYALVGNAGSYRVAAGIFNVVLNTLWCLSQFLAVGLSLVARFKFGGVLHHSPQVLRMSMALFQLMHSFALFNLPYVLYILISHMFPVKFDALDILLGWKTFQGAADALIIYFLFLKQSDLQLGSLKGDIPGGE